MCGACNVTTPYPSRLIYVLSCSPVYCACDPYHIRCSKARVILADEAAAHVDDETENKISLAFVRAAAQGRTVLSVAHR